MGKLTFYIVDVFAEEKFAGNQMSVVNQLPSLRANFYHNIKSNFS